MALSAMLTSLSLVRLGKKSLGIFGHRKTSASLIAMYKMDYGTKSEAIFTVQIMLAYNCVNWTLHKRRCVITINSQFMIALFSVHYNFILSSQETMTVVIYRLALV